MHVSFRIMLFGSVLSLLACNEARNTPAVPVPDSIPVFVGSDSCGDCHATQYSDWQTSHHDLAMQVADETTVLGDFGNQTFNYYDTETHFFRQGGAYVVRTANSDGELEDFRVAYTFGVTPLQQYLVAFEDGRLQALPFTWDSRAAQDGGQRWYHLYPDEYIGPGDELHWLGREQNWNYQCAECHSTDVVLNYDLDSDSFDTTWFEIDVGCEACHGPASRHVENARTGAVTRSSGLLVDLDDRGHAVWQMNSQSGIAERSLLAMRPPQQPESCGRCHSRRGVIATEYEYGKPLADTHRPALLNPPLYFEDGQIRDEVYVYGSFLQSRMYGAGVTCSDCHNPHSLELVTGGSPNDVCAQCHLPTKFASTDHHRHAPEQVECVDCHMRSRVYMGVDARRDHSFRIPRPEFSVNSDVPNACNSCHTRQDAEWAAARSVEWWGSLPTRGFNEAPGIVRATALTALAGQLSQDDIGAIERALRNGDPLVRLAALRAARNVPPELQLRLATPLLADAVRSVRLEAATVLAPLHQYLPADSNAVFLAAADEYRAAQRAVASRPEAHAALGDFEGRLGNIDAALSHIRQALRMAPDSPIMHHAHGLLLVRAGQQETALEELREASRLDPGTSRYTYVYAVALNSLGDSDKAIDVLSGARQKFPDDYDVAWALVTILRDSGETERALGVAREIEAVYPDDADIAALIESLPGR